MQQPIMQRQPVVPPPAEGTGAAVPDPNAPPEPQQQAVMLPPGLTEEFFVSKGNYCNQKFDEYFNVKLLANIKDTLRILAGGQPDGSLPNGTQLPLPQSILHTAMSRLTQAINARPKHIEAVPELTPLLQPVSSDDQQCYEDWMNQAIQLIPDFDVQFSAALQNAIQESVGCMELMWAEQPEEAAQLLQDEMGQPAGVNPLQRIKGRAELKARNMFQMAWDPREKFSFSKASWVRTREMVSANELLRLESTGAIQDAQAAINEAPKQEGTNTANMQAGTKDPEAERVRAVQNQNLPVINYEDGIFQLDRFYATVSWKNPETQKWQTQDFYYWVVGGQKLVRLKAGWMKNGRKPFLTLPLLRGGEGLVGTSLIDLVKDALRDLATTSSRQNRVLTRVAETPTFYGVGSGLNAKSKLMQENALVPVFDVDQVKLAPIPVQILDAMREHMLFLISQIREGTPANDQSQGIVQEGVGTATESENLAAGSSSRFDWMALVLCTGFFPELGSMLQEVNALYVEPEDLSYRTAGMDGESKQLPMELLLRPWRYVATKPVEEAYKRRRYAEVKGILTELTTVELQTPQLLMEPDGSRYEVDFVNVVNETLLPLAGLEGKRFFRKIAAPVAAPVVDPQTGQPVQQDGMPQPGPEQMGMAPAGPPATPPALPPPSEVLQ